MLFKIYQSNLGKSGGTETDDATSELRKADLRPVQVHPSPTPDSEYRAIEVCTPKIAAPNIGV